MNPPPYVIKLGGSVDQAGTAAEWLRVLWAYRRQGLALVPGGGEFADAVRRQQRVQGFDDSQAHGQALRAMEQTAERLIALGERGGMSLVGVEDAGGFARAFASGQLPVWLPVHWADASGELERSWRVTSDTLALWLANQLGCARVVLIKSLTAEPGPHACSRAVAAGWVDAAFDEWRQRTGCQVWLFGAKQQTDLGELLAGQPMAQSRLD